MIDINITKLKKTVSVHGKIDHGYRVSGRFRCMVDEVAVGEYSVSEVISVRPATNQRILVFDCGVTNWSNIQDAYHTQNHDEIVFIRLFEETLDDKCIVCTIDRLSFLVIAECDLNSPQRLRGDAKIFEGNELLAEVEIFEPETIGMSRFLYIKGNDRSILKVAERLENHRACQIIF